MYQAGDTVTISAHPTAPQETLRAMCERTIGRGDQGIRDQGSGRQGRFMVREQGFSVMDENDEQKNT